MNTDGCSRETEIPLMRTEASQHPPVWHALKLKGVLRTKSLASEISIGFLDVGNAAWVRQHGESTQL